MSPIFAQKYSNHVMVYKQVQVHFDLPEQLQELLALGIEPMEIKGNHIKTILSEADLSIIQTKGYSYDVEIEDMQKDFIRRNEEDLQLRGGTRNTDCENSNNLIDYPTPSNFELGSMGGYFTMEEVYAEFNDMHTLYPNLISALEPISDFETFEGRNLYVARLSDNPDTNEDEPEILFTAIHHAREPESISQLIFYVWYLLENYDTNPEVQTILNNTELYIVPLVNPDGYNYNATTFPDGGGLWRKNRRDHGDGNFGVDPNRNYSIQWGTTGISFDTSSDVYCGTEAFSEPENQAMKWLCENHEFRMALNNHTYSELLLFPFGYDTDQPTPDNAYYETIAAHMVSQNGYTDEIAATLYPASGDSDDWMYTTTPEKEKIYAFTPEIGYSFWPVSSDIIPIAKEMVFLNLTASHLVTDYALATEISPIAITSLSPSAEFNLQSLGLDVTNNFTVSLEAVSANISTVGAPQSFTDVANMEEVTGSIDYTLNSSILPGDEVLFNLVVDQGGYNISVPVTKIYGNTTTVLSDEGLDTDNWTTDSWGITTSTYHTAPSCFADSPNGNYQNNQNTSFILNNSIDLSNASNANMTFFAKWNIENDWDYVQVLVNNAPQCGLYTNTGSNNQDEGQPLYDGIQSDWVQEYIDLSDYLGQEITISFNFVSDNGVTEDGFYFDDFEIHTIGAVGIEELQMNENALICTPNPATDVVKFTLDSKLQANQSYLVLTNALGQKIKKEIFTTNTISLDIQDLPEGIYYYSLHNNSQQILTKKLLIIR